MIYYIFDENNICSHKRVEEVSEAALSWSVK